MLSGWYGRTGQWLLLGASKACSTRPKPSRCSASPRHAAACLPACQPACLPPCLPACHPSCLLACRRPLPRAKAPGPGQVSEALQEDPGNTVWRKPRRSPIPGLLKAAAGLAPRPPRLPSLTARHLAVRHHTTLGCSLGRGWKGARALRPLLPSRPAPPGSQRLFPSPRASAASHQAFPSRLPHLVQTHRGAPSAPRQHHQPEYAALAGPREMPGPWG